MRLRRKSKSPALTKRQRKAADDGQGASTFAYRSHRTDQTVNLGRQVPRENDSGAPQHLGHFLLRRFGLIILLIVLVLSAVNVLRLSSDAKVLSLNGASDTAFLHDKAVYQAAASQLLASSIWNRNKITVNTASVHKAMLDQFPELSDVSVTLPLFSKRPIVYVQSAKPALILSTQSGSFVLDTTGKALVRADTLPAGSQLNLPVVTDQSDLTVRLNHQALSSESVNFIRVAIAQLAARQFTVSGLVLPVGTSELDVHLVGQPYGIKFNLQSGDARQQTGTFLATQAKLQSQNITPAQYVDVRVEGRAYYQ